MMGNRSIARLALVFATLALFTTATTGQPASQPVPLVIVTQGEQRGIREGEKFYPLGMPLADFRRDFGTPEAEGTDHLDYRSDGVRVISQDRRTVTQIIVFLSDARVLDDQFRASPNATTDTGIRRESTYREIVRACGDPTQRSDRTDGGFVMKYPWGQINTSPDAVRSVSVGAN